MRASGSKKVANLFDESSDIFLVFRVLISSKIL